MRSSSSCRSSNGRTGNPLLSLALGAVFSCAVQAAGAQPRPFAASDMAAFRTISGLAVSPDGGTAVIAVRSMSLTENRQQTDLWSVKIDGSRPPRQLTHDRATESALRWTPDGSRIGFLADRDGARQVWALPIDGGEAVRLTSHPQPVVAFDWSPDAGRLAIVAPPAESAEELRRRQDRDDGYLLGQQWRNGRLWVVVPGKSEAPRELTDGRMHVTQLAWSPSGRSIAIVTAPNAEADASEDARAQVVDVETGRVRNVPQGDRAGTLAWSPDGTRLAFARAFDGKGISREDLYVWDGTDAAPVNMSAAVDRDAEAIFWTRDGKAIDLRIAHGAAHTIVRVDAASGAVSATRRFPHSVGVLGPAGNIWVYARTDRPAELHAGNPESDARVLTALNAAAANLQLPTAEAVRWKSSFGQIEGVLFKPYGYKAGQRYPLLVNPHGGPRAHSNLDFSPDVAYWTSRGFVVLRPNFRGSTGYGDRFTKGNIGDWGAGPFEDTMAGVDHLIAQGIADPDRLFLFGWSYGGIMANWATTHTDRFKAIASGAGVADLRMQYSISDARRWRFDYFTGSPFTTNWPIYERESAVTYANRAKTPTLFVHGAEDDRCPIEQGLMMYRALMDNGVTTEMLVYPREGHGFTEPRHLVDRAKRVADWFARFDTGAPRPTTSSGS